MGLAVGSGDGRCVGARDGSDVDGRYVGWALTEGLAVGARLGRHVGEADTVGLALIEGAKDGDCVGEHVGVAVGRAVGDSEGSAGDIDAVRWL